MEISPGLIQLPISFNCTEPLATHRVWNTKRISPIHVCEGMKHGLVSVEDL